MEQNWFGRGLTLVGGAWLALVLELGCASPGPPGSPSLHLPNLVDKLEAQRVGNEVRLTWLTPANTTDGVSTSGSIMAVVCREIRRADTKGNSTTACDPVARMAVVPGAAQTLDVLPQNLSMGAPALLAYRIELLNDRGRSAGKSDPVYAAGGEAPAPVGPLTVSPRRGAALIQWRAQPSDSAQQTTMELHRTLAVPAQGPTPARSEHDRPAALPTRRTPGALKASTTTPFGVSKEQPGEVTLTAGAAQGILGSSAAPGGMLDGTVHDGANYVYVAQRVTKVTLGGEDLELRGMPSPPSAFACRETFPPRPPSGLVSVPGTGFGGMPSIDMSWEPNTESDLLGYNVYRRTASGAFAKLNARPVPSSSFRDMQVTPGQAYDYRVTAVDRRLNESAPSSEIHESFRK